jgi:L-asparaginase/Glu-tRNA(Gln) amidotransferase subunit D
MKRFASLLASLTVLLLAQAAVAKPKVVILATGGTIAGAQASTSEAGDACEQDC